MRKPRSAKARLALINTVMAAVSEATGHRWRDGGAVGSDLAYLCWSIADDSFCDAASFAPETRELLERVFPLGHAVWHFID